MSRVPISLIVDDPAPVVSVYCAHADSPFTADGRPLVSEYPNELLLHFCDIIERRGVRGKFSVIPMPANRGDILHGLRGVDDREMRWWLDVVRTRVAAQFSIGPEMLTHHRAVDPDTGRMLDMREDEFSRGQTREVLTPYIAKALSLLKEAGFSAVGVTSPWDFGLDCEDEYHAAVSRAVYDVTGSENAWLFLRCLMDRPDARPWIAREENGRTLVAIPATTGDHTWQTIDTPETGDALVSSIADGFITADGKSGDVIRVLETGGYPILMAHWQGLMSNGLGTGLRVLDEVARRINEHLSDRVEWMSFEQIMHLVLADRAAYPMPAF